MHYHVWLESENSVDYVYKMDMNIEELINRIINPYYDGDIIVIKGQNIDAYKIRSIRIIETEKPYSEYIELIRQKPSEVVSILPDEYYIYDYGTDVTDKYINKPVGSIAKERRPANNINLKAQNKIFIVHGRDHVTRDQIDLYLSKHLKLNTEVMDAEAQGGRTLAEKLEDLADKCRFAVIIITPDDKLRYSDDNQREISRARQNVIFEAGFFWGLLGRKSKLAILVEKDDKMELPSDIDGMGYIPITDDLEETKRRLTDELKASGIL